jgi:ABC-type multidrug transport system ATPase subunit
MLVSAALWDINLNKMQMEIRIESISKSFGDVRALVDVTFDVNAGELFGLIGPDGGGKTTLFRILTTLMLPDSGNAVVAGYPISDYQAIRRSVGYMPGRFSLYPDLTVEENLKFFASIFGTTVEKNYELIRDIYVQIEPFRDRRAGALSGGMKQKLALCCALIHRPKVLFLDEPTTGVDPVSRKEFWEMLDRLRQDGMAILVSTAYMDEASLCDRVALIHQGKILTTDTPANITVTFGRPLYAIRTSNVYEVTRDTESYAYARTIYPFGEHLHYTDKREKPDPIELEDFLRGKGHHDIELTAIEPTIEDAFMELAETHSQILTQ